MIRESLMMRVMPAGILLLFLLLPLSVSAQSVVLTDSAGDAPLAGTPVNYDAIDIETVDVAIDESGLAVIWSFVDLTLDDLNSVTNAEAWVEIEYRDTTFHAVLRLTSPDTVDPSSGDPIREPSTLVYRSSPDTWILLSEESGGEIDATTSSGKADFDWTRFLSEDEFFPAEGQDIEITGAGSLYSSNPNSWRTSSLTSVEAWDAVPVESPVALQLPSQQSLVLVASTQHPLRFSNGEATTMHWPIELENKDSEAMEVIFEWDVPDNIEVQIPASVVIEAGETAYINAFASLPFAHQHGTQLNLPLHARSSSHETTIPLGVSYPATPQPAGHHNSLFLHGQAVTGASTAPGLAWMNADQSDPTATASAILPTSGQCLINDPEFQAGHGWRFPLQPRLLIGLDARVEESSQIGLELVSNEPLLGGNMYARFLLGGSGDDIVLNTADEFVAVSPVAQALTGGVVSVELEVPTPPELDLVPPTQAENLELQLVYCPDIPSAAGILVISATQAQNIALPLTGQDPALYLTPNAEIRMPLNEYHDVISLPEAEHAVTLSIDEPVRSAAVGAQVLFEVQVGMSAQAGDAYAVTLIGPSKSLATIHGARELDGQDDSILPVSITIPDYASAGDILEFVVSAQNVDDPTDAHAIRLAVRVDPGSEADDSAAIAALSGESNDAPGLSAILVAAIVAFSGLVFRRRQLDE